MGSAQDQPLCLGRDDKKTDLESLLQGYDRRKGFWRRLPLFLGGGDHEAIVEAKKCLSQIQEEVLNDREKCHLLFCFLRNPVSPGHASWTVWIELLKKEYDLNYAHAGRALEVCHKLRVLTPERLSLFKNPNFCHSVILLFEDCKRRGDAESQRLMGQHFKQLETTLAYIKWSEVLRILREAHLLRRPYLEHVLISAEPLGLALTFRLLRGANLLIPLQSDPRIEKLILMAPWKKKINHFLEHPAMLTQQRWEKILALAENGEEQELRSCFDSFQDAHIQNLLEEVHEQVEGGQSKSPDPGPKTALHPFSPAAAISAVLFGSPLPQPDLSRQRGHGIGVSVDWRGSINAPADSSP